MRGELVRESLSEKVTFESKLEEGKTGRAKTADVCVKSISRQRATKAKVVRYRCSRLFDQQANVITAVRTSRRVVAEKVGEAAELINEGPGFHGTDHIL